MNGSAYTCSRTDGSSPRHVLVKLDELAFESPVAAAEALRTP